MTLSKAFFTCDLPIDVVEPVLCVKTKQRKHTLKEDQEKRTEKYRPWERQTDNDSPRQALESLSPSVTSDLVPWLPTPEFNYKPTLFEDPRNSHPNKENMPPLEPALMPILNIEESDFLDRTKKLLGNENKWEAHVAQQVPLPRSSFPYPSDDQTGSLEQLEPKTVDDMDVRDFSEKPANDQRPPKPPKKPKEGRGIIPEKKKVPRGWSACLKR